MATRIMIIGASEVGKSTLAQALVKVGALVVIPEEAEPARREQLQPQPIPEPIQDYPLMSVPLTHSIVRRRKKKGRNRRNWGASWIQDN